MHPRFETNLARLRCRDGRFAGRVAGATTAVAERHAATDGRVALRVGGLQLASTYDPAEEGRRVVAPLLQRDPDLFVVIGMGLGHAIEAFRAERAAPVLIYDPSLPRVRLALEERDLSWLGDRTCHWAESRDDFIRTFRGLYSAGLRVETWVHPVAKRLDRGAVGEALAALANAKRNADIADRTRALMSGVFAEQSVDNLDGLLRSPPLSRLAGCFEGVPAVIAAAGPSLDRQLETLQALARGALVVAIGQSLPALRRAGIRPDLTHIVESQDVSHQLSDGGSAEDVDLVVIPSAHSSLFSASVATRFVAYPAPNPMARWIAGGYGEASTVPGAPTVAQSAVHVAAALGANPILLIGQDLAFSGGRVYAAGSAYDMVSFRTTGDGRFVYTGDDEKARLMHQGPRGPESRSSELVWVPGSEGEPVPTSPQYASFLAHYAEVADAHRSAGTRIVNCTEGGAQIPGVEHAPFAETLRDHGAADVPRRAIRERFRSFKAWDPDALRPRLDEAQRCLRRATRVRASMQRVVKRAHGSLAHANAARQVGALRRLARVERGLEHAVERLPWLDMVGQRSVLRSAIKMHRTRELAPWEAAMEEADALLATTEESLARGRELLERLDKRLVENAGRTTAPGSRSERRF